MQGAKEKMGKYDKWICQIKTYTETFESMIKVQYIFSRE